MRYSANSPRQARSMLADMGVENVQDLFSSIPPDHRNHGPLDIEGPVPESDLLRRLDGIDVTLPRVSLTGAGLYDHEIPSTVRSLVQRSEWVTSYTPYQPEISQGTLVMYYEFQTWVSLLTGQEVANGGMYDGSTALAEAVLMARRLRRKARRVYVSEAVHPEYREVLSTYLQFQDVELRLLPVDSTSGRTLLDVSSEDQRDALAFVLQSPNFFGVIEDAEGLDPEAFVISVVTEAASMAILPPLRASIAVGEIQALGIPVQLGGPTAGFFATRKDWVRQMPGRLVARTMDNRGQQAWCITLATREQFIRRGKATSNICTSSGLMCLYSAVYMAFMGSGGLAEVARRSARAAHAFCQGLQDLELPRIHQGPWFNEFVVDLSSRPQLFDSLSRDGFILGVPLERWFPDRKHQCLVALTERHYPLLGELLQEVRNHAHPA